MATRVRWLGHSCLLIESDGKRVLIDPYLDGNPAAAAGPGEVEADLILVSHGHFDHLGDARAIARRTGATVVANYELANWLEGEGLAKVVGMNLGGGAQVDPAVHVRMTEARHSSSLPGGGYGGAACGFLLTFADGSRVYDAADTALFGDMALIGEGGLDLAALPIGDHFTMGPDDALRAVKLLRPRAVLPIHYDTFPPIRQDARGWADRVRAETPAEVFLPGPGGWSTIR